MVYQKILLLLAFSNNVLLNWLSKRTYSGITFTYSNAYQSYCTLLCGEFSIEGIASRETTNVSITSLDWISNGKRCYMSALLLIGV